MSFVMSLSSLVISKSSFLLMLAFPNDPHQSDIWFLICISKHLGNFDSNFVSFNQSLTTYCGRMCACFFLYCFWQAAWNKLGPGAKWFKSLHFFQDYPNFSKFLQLFGVSFWCNCHEKASEFSLMTSALNIWHSGVGQWGKDQFIHTSMQYPVMVCRCETGTTDQILFLLILFNGSRSNMENQNACCISHKD